MPANVVDRLLSVTDEETRQKINALLQYPEDSAGSIMNVEYISLRKEMTVEEAILRSQLSIQPGDDLYLLCDREEKIDRGGGRQGSSDGRRVQIDRRDHG